MQKNQIEFRFLGTGGSANGRWGIAAFVALAICAMAVLVILAKIAPIFGYAILGLVRGR